MLPSGAFPPHLIDHLPTVVPSERPDLCNGSVMYGKLVALQREIGRRGARGALRASGPRLEHQARDHKVIQHLDLLRSPPVRLCLRAVPPAGWASEEVFSTLHTDILRHAFWQFAQ